MYFPPLTEVVENSVLLQLWALERLSTQSSCDFYGPARPLSQLGAGKAMASISNSAKEGKGPRRSSLPFWICALATVCLIFTSFKRLMFLIQFSDLGSSTKLGKWLKVTGPLCMYFEGMAFEALVAGHQSTSYFLSANKRWFDSTTM